MDLQALSDRLEIGDLLSRYARAVDSKDWKLWRTVFTDDAHVDYTPAGGIAGDPDTVADWLAGALAAFPMTQHFITNVEIDLRGDRATVRAMFYNPMQLTGFQDLTFCGGNYQHELVRTGDGWKSERMVDSPEWFVNPPPMPAADQ